MSLNRGYSFAQISELLLLDDNTIRSIYNLYQEQGIEGLLQFNYVSGLAYLSALEIQELSTHLESNMYLHSKYIAQYIATKYAVNYTYQGVRDLLKRMGFVYKKTKHLPGKGDLQKQQEFVENYHQLKSNLSKNDAIYFMDGVHPLHNSMTCNGWIKKGKEKAIKANTGRDRLNINGACNVEKAEVIIHEDVSVNAQSTIQLFDKLQKHQTAGKIHVIADNARYYRSNLVAAYLKTNTRVNLIFLPPYSPNLNLIERLWKFYKKEKLYNKYYENFIEFKIKTIAFFENLETHKQELITLLKDNFYFPVLKFSQT